MPTRTGSRRWVLSAAILGSSITFIDGTVVNVALPVLQQRLHASVVAAQWIVEAYALMLAALILVGGALGDRLGRKRVFSAGVVLFAAASAWCGLSGGTAELIVARAVQGVGAALLVPGSLALISASFGPGERGRAFGTWSGVTAMAAGAGPVLGGWLIQRFSWRWIFFINLPLAVAVVLITWRHVPESRDEQAHGRIDWPGAALATLGLGAIVFGLVESNRHAASGVFLPVTLGAGVALLAAFLLVESRRPAPMMPLELFRSTTFAGANLLTLFLYAALGGVLFFLPFDLIQVQGYTPLQAGAALLPFVLTMFLLSRWAGGLVARYGSRLPLASGPLVAGAGFASFALPSAHAGSYWSSFFPCIMVMSLGMAVSVAPLTTTVMGAVEERHAGVASGVNNAVARAASVVAVAVSGVVMLHGFRTGIAGATRVPAAVRAMLLARSADLLDLGVPSGTGSRAGVEAVVHTSFVHGFRQVALLAGLLAGAGALASWLMIRPGPPRD